jgi:hypothetical protein
MIWREFWTVLVICLYFAESFPTGEFCSDLLKFVQSKFSVKVSGVCCCNLNVSFNFHWRLNVRAPPARGSF